MKLTMKHVIDSINEVIDEMNRIKENELEDMISGIGSVVLERSAKSENEILSIIMGAIGFLLLDKAQMKLEGE